MLASGAPQRHVALGHESFAKVELPEFQQHFLDDPFVYQADPLVFRCLQDGERWEHVGQSRHRETVRTLVQLAQAEDAVVRVQDAKSADLVLQRQNLRFELDPIGALDIWPHGQRGCLLLVRMTELEDDFRIAHVETIDVAYAPPKDKGVVVEAKIRGITKNDVPYIWPQADLRVGDIANFQTLCRALH